MRGLEELCRRFPSGGVDLSARAPGRDPHWPKRWRARLVTAKNERQPYRLTAWGDTLEAAASALVEAVVAEDER